MWWTQLTVRAQSKVSYEKKRVKIIRTPPKSKRQIHTMWWSPYPNGIMVNQIVIKEGYPVVGLGVCVIALVEDEYTTIVLINKSASSCSPTQTPPPVLYFLTPFTCHIKNPTLSPPFLSLLRLFVSVGILVLTPLDLHLSFFKHQLALQITTELKYLPRLLQQLQIWTTSVLFLRTGPLF